METLLILQSYTGVDPPFVGFEVNVTEVPEQIEPVGEAAIEMEGTKLFDTVIAIELEVVLTGDAQPAFETRVHVNASPFTIELVIYVDNVAPLMVAPFFFH